MPIISSASLMQLAVQALVNAGASVVMARTTAQALVAAEMQGLASHGLGRLEAYRAHLRNGRANGAAEPVVLKHKRAVLLVDARQGLAYPACQLAISLAIETARQQGVAFAAVANSHHFGAAANQLLPAVEQGLIGLAFGNSPAAMPAWGGKRALLGTNPLAAVFPRRGQDPLIMDMSLSAAARGKLVVAERNGQAIPEGWALDADGQPTTDPKAGLAGTLLAAGGLKGTLLAIMIELLAAALTGSNFGYEADSFLTEEGRAPQVGQVFLLIDPAALAGRDVYLDRVEALVDAMLADEGVRLPGASRLARQQAAQAHGVDIPEALLDALREWAGAPV
ncbi:Malate dehydrogenase [plant metagenome]|uniref:Malate dehydrogenase n=1 Tax=plant metagenome TaxID=1297885 RepID=A0A484UB59_9ZZZZ